MWSGKSLHSNIINARIAWLSNTDTLFNTMEITDDLPEPLRFLVKRMFNLLFPPSYPIYDLNPKAPDPRVRKVDWSAWVDVFKKAGDCAGPDIHMPHFAELHKYVSPKPNRRISFISQPLDELEDCPPNLLGSDDEGSSGNDGEGYPESPTPADGSNKRPSALITLAEGSSLSKRPRTQGLAELDEADANSTESEHIEK
ncbi:hypothetical protein GGI23_005386 [Coemansia sp. RSA 2559]|nr:hypothetical protein GGI23_005386 [Coemansia sp. RSA 2559]